MDLLTLTTPEGKNRTNECKFWEADSDSSFQNLLTIKAVCYDTGIIHQRLDSHLLVTLQEQSLLWKRPDLRVIYDFVINEQISSGDFQICPWRINYYKNCPPGAGLVAQAV